MKVLVIPDCHLREFWKDAVKDWNGPIIFLGDYVDPYPYEWYEDEQMPNPVDYLLEVINFKDCNPDRVTLLIGNHDQHYINTNLDGSRKNYSLQEKLHDFYMTDKEYFQIAKQIDDTLFTHAGVSTAWLKRHELTLPKTDADLFLNEIYKTSPDIFWEMNAISSSTDTKTETVIQESDDGNGNIVETEVTVTHTYLYITVSHKTAGEMAAQYGFSEDQKEQLAELLADENKEALIRKLRLEYDDATEREIEKALNDAEEKFGQNPDEKALNAFLRTKLES